MPDLRRLFRGLVDDPGYKALAILLAFGAWFWVQSQEVDTARIRVAIDWRLPEELVPLDPVLNGATVIVQGSRASIRRAQARRPRMVVDLRDETVGAHDCHLDAYELEDMPSGLATVGFAPDVVTVRLDERARRNVAIAPQWVGQPADDHDIQVVTVAPDVVEVTGPRQVVEGLETVSTMPVDVSGWSETTTFAAELDLPRGVSTVHSWEGEVEVVIQNLVTEITIPEVAVVVPGRSDWVPAEGHEEVTVRLRGPTRILRGLRTDRILAVVDLPADPVDDRYVARHNAPRAPRMEIVVPPGVEVVDPPDRVEVVRR